MGDKWSPQDVLEVIVNPIYTGIGKYPAIVSEEMWVKAVEKVIQEVGTHKALTTMLKEMRAAFAEEIADSS